LGFFAYPPKRCNPGSRRQRGLGSDPDLGQFGEHKKAGGIRPFALPRTTPRRLKHPLFYVLQERPVGILPVAVVQRGRFSLVALGFGALDAADRVVADGVDLAEVVEKGSDRGKFSADGAGGQAAALEVFLARRFRWARVTCRISSGRSTLAKAVKRSGNDSPENGPLLTTLEREPVQPARGTRPFQIIKRSCLMLWAFLRWAP
jgi:hypothetical protein